MDESLASRYWCHMCSRIVNPVMEVVEIKCPRCDSGFIEEMMTEDGERSPPPNHHNPASAAAAGDLGNPNSDLSLWAPILLGMLTDGLRRRHSRSRRDEDSSDTNATNAAPNPDQEDDDLMSLFRRRQRTSAILEVLTDLQARLQRESDNSEREREREHMVLINPFNQAIIIQGGGGGETQNAMSHIGASLGDYFLGPGLEQLLQHLAENDPSRHGTPPAKKEVVEAMPTVEIKERTSCYVCLEDFEVGEEAREMPCKHRFHGGCILPWLEAHSTCPVCRYQMPTEEPKDANVGGGRSEERREERGDNGGGNDGESGGNGRRFWIPVPWPFSGFFSLSASASPQNGGGQGGNGSGNSSLPSASGGSSDV